MTRLTGAGRTRFLLILDDPQMPEAENWPAEVKIEYLKQTTDQDSSIVRFAVINSEHQGRAQEFFLLHMMEVLTTDYHENEDTSEEGERGGEQLPG